MRSTLSCATAAAHSVTTRQISTGTLFIVCIFSLVELPQLKSKLGEIDGDRI
jgi:hypothetical protein